MINQKIPGRSHTPLLVAVFLMAATITLIEVTLFNALIVVSHYVLASMTIAIALVGTALGGIVANWLVRKQADSILRWAFAAAGGALLLVGALFLFSSSILYGVIFLVLPFFFAATVISIGFAKLPSGKVYLVDLTGAALGIVLAAPLLSAIREEGTLTVAAALPLVAAAVVAWTDRRRTLSAAAAAIAIAAIVLGPLGVQQGWLNLASNAACREDRGKVFCARERKGKSWKSSRVIASGSHLVGRIDVVDRGDRFARSTFLHGYSADTISKLPPRKYRWDIRLPWGYIKDPDTLIIGLAAQGVTKTARGLGNGKVTGIEISPAIVDLMRTDLYEMSGRAYDDIDVHVMDGRTFVELTQDRYDFITLMNAHRGRNADYLGAPEHLLTVEAMEAYLEKLTPRGAVSIEELATNGPRSSHAARKIVETALEALRRRGVEDPKRHILAYYWWFGARYLQVMVSREPFPAEGLAYLRKWLVDAPKKGWTKKAKLILDPEWTEPKSKFAREVYDPNRYEREAAQGRTLYATSDDRPFPTHTYAWAPDFLLNLGVSIALALLLILLPATLLLRSREQAVKRGRAADMTYFGLLGIGYMVLEIALIQRYQLYLGSPAYSFVAVLGSMLLASGFGGYFLRATSPKRGAVASFAVAAVGLVTYGLLGPLCAATQGLPLAARLLLTVLTVAPVSFLMGAPLPNAMEAVRRRRGDAAVPVAYAVAGALGVVGTSLAYWLAVVVGFRLTTLVGVVAYALAGLVALRVFRSGAVSAAEQGAASDEPTGSSAPTDVRPSQPATPEAAEDPADA